MRLAHLGTMPGRRDGNQPGAGIRDSGDMRMIVFNLSCSNDHRFEGWFASAADFERQQQSSLLSCPLCGSSKVVKVLHAPYVNTGGSSKPPENESRAKDAPGQYANVSDELAQLIDHLIANTEDVGDSFPEEARRIHYQEAPERKIRGSASSEEVRDMREEGIEVMALPIPRHRLGKAH
jgi:hypothetical protein